MNRFKTSKYRHTTGKAAKKEDSYMELNVSSQNLDSNMVAASRQLVGFVWETAGAAGSVGVFPLAKTGKLARDMTVLAGHSGPITDLAFDPFDDFALATGSGDNTVKYWQLDPEKVKAGESDGSETVVFSGHQKAVQNVAFHPHASGVLMSTGQDRTVRLWDLESGKERSCLGGDDVYADSIFWGDWADHGRLIVTSSKDKKIRLWDPRANSVVAEGPGHDGTKASRVLWLGESDKFVSTGFSKTRDRQWFIWDANNMSAPLSKQTMGASTGLLMPFYDSDTKLLYIAGKGDGNIRSFEITEKAPWFSEVGSFASSEPTRGMAMVPKQACDVMSCEVARLLKATKATIEPVNYCVPRQRMREFQDDLFPNTRGGVASQKAADWFDGKDAVTQKIALRPGATPLPMPDRLGGAAAAAAAANASSSQATDPSSSQATESYAHVQADVKYEPPSTKSSTRSVGGAGGNKAEDDFDRDAAAIAKTVSAKIIRESHYRHISGRAWKKELNYDGVKLATAEVTSSVKANKTFIGIPWTGAGGHLGIVPVDKPGRLAPDHPVISGHTAAVVDFDFDPFDDHLVATGAEDTHVKVWKIPAGGLTESITEPLVDLRGHEHKVTVVQYHPTAKGVLSTASFDQTIRIWDVESATDKLVLEGMHDDSIYALAWNADGSLLASTCRDTKLRIIDPRAKTVVQTGTSHDSLKGSRLTWLGDRNQIITTGFSKSSQRQYMLWDARDLSSPLQTQDVDIGNGLLSPYFDEGTGVLFLAGKGDGNVRTYEVNNKDPFVHYLTDFRSANPQNGVAFMPKSVCDVKKCEFTRFVRLCKSFVETVEFTVPRTRMEFFQDDIFPPTPDVHTPALSASEWFSGSTKKLASVSLCPSGMKPLSEAPVEEKKVSKYSSSGVNRETKDLPASREEVFDGFFKKVQENKDPDFVPGQGMEGVEDDEWDD